MSNKIKIPPSKIFDIDHSPMPLNAYNRLSLAQTNYKYVNGDIVTPITFNFRSISSTGEDENVEYDVSDLGTKDEDGYYVYSGTSFTRDTTSGKAELVSEITFTGLQKVRVEDESPYLSNLYYKLYRETTYCNYSVYTGYSEPYIERTEEDVIATSYPEGQVTINYRVVLNEIVSTGNEKVTLSQKVSIRGTYIKETDNTVAYYPNNAVGISGEFALPTNELVQGDNTYGTITDYATDYAEEFLFDVYNRYRGGKETATLLCAVSKYYELDGTLLIDPEAESASVPPLFKKYDIVVPYIASSNGEIPLSKKPDGTAKMFQIIGVNIKYNGVLRQEIVIQEYAT